ncbi:hypothetical protein Tco_0002193 [Tanacetum coccineum]
MASNSSGSDTQKLTAYTQGLKEKFEAQLSLPHQQGATFVTLPGIFPLQPISGVLQVSTVKCPNDIATTGVSIQGTHRTLSAPRSPKPKSNSQKLKGKVVGELSEPRKPLKIKLKHPQPAPISFMVPVLTTAKIEQHQVFETQDLSHAEFISAKEFNEKQVVAEVDDTVLIEQSTKCGTRLDPWSNKENPKEIVDDDDDMIVNVDHDDQALIWKKNSGSLETRNEQMQTPIPIPPRSPRINLSLDREPLLELTDIQDISSEFLFKSGLLGIMKKIDDALYAVLPRIATATTNGLLKDNILVIVRAEVPDIISQEFVAHGGLKEKFDKSSTPPATCIPQASRHPDHDDNSDDNPEGEKTSKKQKSTFSSSSANVTKSSNPTSSSKQAPV